MKYCSQCGKELEDNANFCPSCGARQHMDSKLDEGYYNNDYQQDSINNTQFTYEENSNSTSNDVFGDMYTSEENATNINKEQEKQEKGEKKNLKEIAICALVLAFFVPIAGFVLGIVGIKENNDTSSKYYKMCVAAIVVSIVSFISHIIGIIF